MVISSCAIVLLTINSNDESSSFKLITSVSENSSISDSTETSQVGKTKTAKTTKKSKKATNNTTTRNSSTDASRSNASTVMKAEFPLDINKVTKDELMQIDGVGEVTASKILTYRKKHKYYSNLLQLKDIDGIGDATYEKLKTYLFVSKDKYQDITENNKTATKATKVTTTKAKTKKSTKAVQTTTEKKMKMVNINTADKEELIDCLLIDEEEALDIIELREKIGGKFTDTLELIYGVGLSEYNRIKDYITV